jgi:ParB/RepB/Spo0J family partition protein
MTAPTTAADCLPVPAYWIPVGQIAPDPDQPRVSYSEERLQELAASIRTSGIVQALLVSPHPEPRARAATPYMLIAGERRWLAARRAGLAAVPAIVRTEPPSASDRLMLQICENDRDLAEDLALFDFASAVARSFELAACSQAQFAQRHRRSQTWLSFMLSLAHAEGPAREALEENRLQGILAARAFLRLAGRQQRKLLTTARCTGAPITVRLAERAAARNPELRRDAEQADASTPSTPSSDPRASAPSRPAADPAADLPAPSAAPAATHAAGAAPASHGTGLLPTHLKLHLEASGPPINVRFAPLQLVTLLILLGLEPAPTPQDQVAQLLACL